MTAVDCSDDTAQIWTVTDYYTIQNGDGKCITMGKPAIGAPVRVSDILERMHDSDSSRSGYALGLCDRARIHPALEPYDGLSIWEQIHL